MKVGVCMPYMEPDFTRERMLEWCRLVDDGPFSSISCGERITGPTSDMRTLLAAAAAVTESVRIVPSLYVLPMHSAVWAAKEIASLDVVSGGRVTLTVGVGGRSADYRAVEASHERRYQRLDAQIPEMRRIWAGEPPFEGADPVGPTPVQPGGPPILTGSMGPKAITRAARWADGIYAWSGNGQKAEIARILDLADKSWGEAGRERPPRRLAGFWYSLAPDGDRRLQEYVYQYIKILGEELAVAMARGVNRHTPDAVRESLDAMQELGCEETFLVPATAELAEIERAAEILGSR
jgi:alkanesulfonate monooxygenase SsuD/methylene tetrahydromethanopterin reductase-like flavin-dependent oxidoreductase (luciferase family)